MENPFRSDSPKHSLRPAKESVRLNKTDREHIVKDTIYQE